MELTEDFNQTDAVLAPLPVKNYMETFEEMIRSDVYIEGYMIEHEGKSVGYAIVSKQYSHDAGGMAFWIDELFIHPEAQSKGLGKTFLQFMKDQLNEKTTRIRLEVNPINQKAIELYKRIGFEGYEYQQLFFDYEQATGK